MEPNASQDKINSRSLISVASLEHLTGPSSGAVDWLSERTLQVALDPHHFIHIAPSSKTNSAFKLVARLHRKGDGFEIKAAKGCSIWVNGLPIKSKHLHHLDMIEFCEFGPMSRYYEHDKNRPAHRTVIDIVSDAIAYFRTSRQHLNKRIFNAIGQVFHRLAIETTILFRIGVIVSIGFLVALAYQQNRLATLLQMQMDTSTSQIESFSRTLARSNKEALTPSDLEALRLQLGERMNMTAGRISKLERLSTAAQRIIIESTPAIVLLQGAYGFKAVTNNRMLRIVLDKDGQPMLLPNGLPLLSPDGGGPVAERRFIGSGFIVGEDGYLLTNRHVGLPWEYDSGAKMLAQQGLVPVVTKFVAYRPNHEGGEPVKLVMASEDTDLALLQYAQKNGRPKGLQLAGGQPEPGDQIIVMGYPTGLRSILAQAGEVFIKDLQKSGDVGFWEVAVQLSKSGLIIPLASRGIVGRISKERIVYDAETTHGGSGGPVLNTDGEVVAVNAAILPDFGGANLGVPVRKVRDFLKQMKLN